MSDRCRTIKGVHIPGCMGCAVNGHEGCTCERSSKRSIESRYRSALEEIAKMGTAEMTMAGYDLRKAVGLARQALEPQNAKRGGK